MSKLQHSLLTWKTDQTFKKEKVYAESLIKALMAFFSASNTRPLCFLANKKSIQQMSVNQAKVL